MACEQAREQVGKDILVAELLTEVFQREGCDLGHEVAPVEQQSPQGLYAVHKAEIEKWWPIIKAANIKLQ